jgi:CTP synthase
MAANLKDLALIPISDIGPEHEFTTIASVDSPFREQVAWAYLQITGRPGLPERDTSTWAEDIIKAVEK